MFNTVYGDRTFVVLAALVAGLGLLGLFGPSAVRGYLVFEIALVELVFAVILTVRALHSTAAGLDAHSR